MKRRWIVLAAVLVVLAGALVAADRITASVAVSGAHAAGFRAAERSHRGFRTDGSRADGSRLAIDGAALQVEAEAVRLLGQEVSAATLRSPAVSVPAVRRR